MFEARNTSGSVVATHNTVTFGFKSKGRITLTSRAIDTSDANQPAASSLRGTISNSRYNGSLPGGFDDLVAFRPVNPGAGVGIGFNNSSGRSFVGYRNPNNPADQTEAVVDYWIFGKVPTVRDHGVGVEIYNANGTVAMSNVAKPMKIAAISALDTLGVPSVSTSIPGDYAICYGVPAPTANQYTYSSTEGKFYYIEYCPMYNTYDAYGVSGGGRNPSQIKSTFDTGFISNNNAKLTAMLIDVAGL